MASGIDDPEMAVSTHSHPKAAADDTLDPLVHGVVSTHSHPKAAAIGANFVNIFIFSFNTQPPEGGCLPLLMDSYGAHSVSTHSHPKAAAGVICWVPVSMRSFQHTATRRRLLKWQKESIKAERVSTHSHPKAAAPYLKKQEKSAY